MAQSLTLIGVVMVAYGCWLASPALGFVIAGVSLAAAGAWHYRQNGKK